MTDILLIAGGFLFLILTMALILNPPEAWVKKFLRRKDKRSDGSG